MKNKIETTKPVAKEATIHSGMEKPNNDHSKGAQEAVGENIHGSHSSSGIKEGKDAFSLHEAPKPLWYTEVMWSKATSKPPAEPAIKVKLARFLMKKLLGHKKPIKPATIKVR